MKRITLEDLKKRTKGMIKTLAKDLGDWLEKLVTDLVNEEDLPPEANDVLRRTGATGIAKEIAEVLVWAMLCVERMATEGKHVGWTPRLKRGMAAALATHKLEEGGLTAPSFDNAHAEEAIQSLASAAGARLPGAPKPKTKPKPKPEPEDDPKTKPEPAGKKDA